VVAAIKVGFGEQVANAIDRVRRQHQAADDGLLGFHRLRRDAQRLEVVVRTNGFGACGHRTLL